MIASKFKCLLATSAILLSTACDWESGGSSNSYNSRYDWANFSGVYRPVSGRYIVTDFSGGQPEAPGTESQTFQERANEQIGSGNGVRTTFSGITRNRNIVPNSFTLTTAGFSLSDDGSGTLVGSGVSGTIDYASGGWSADFGGSAPDNGSEIRATYTYTVITNAIPGSPAREPGPGSSGIQIFSFTIQQSGQRLVFVDNTGREYQGDMGTIRSTRGASQDTHRDSADPLTGDTVIGQFSVSGLSAANQQVKITGTLQGVVAANGVLTNRSLQGTWIESSGRSGNVNGQAAPIRIDMTPTQGGTDPF